MNYALYDLVSGQVLQAGNGNPENLEQVPVGMGRLELPEDFMLLQDAWVEAGQLHRVPEAPGPGYRWSWDTKAWQVDLAKARAQRWEHIKRARDAAEFGGFTWAGSRFDSDAISQSRIQGAVLQAQVYGAGFMINWTLADNSTRTLDFSQMIGMAQAMGTHIGTCHEVGRMLRAQINAATTLEEIQAVSWP